MQSVTIHTHTLSSDEIKQAMLEYFVLHYSLKIPENHSINFDIDSNEEIDSVDLSYKQEG